MIDYLALPDSEAESVIFATLTTYATEDRQRYASIGLMADTVEKKLLWRHRTDPADGFPCRSFARWAHICPYPYATLYAAMRDVQALADVPAASLMQVPQSNFRTLKQLSTAVRHDPAVLEAARGRTEALVAYVKANYPRQHVEGERVLRVPLSEGQMEDVQKAIAKAMARGCASPSEAVWMWAVEELTNEEIPGLEEADDAKCGHA